MAPVTRELILGNIIAFGSEAIFAQGRDAEDHAPQGGGGEAQPRRRHRALRVHIVSEWTSARPLAQTLRRHRATIVTPFHDHFQHEPWRVIRVPTMGGFDFSEKGDRDAGSDEAEGVPPREPRPV